MGSLPEDGPPGPTKQVAAFVANLQYDAVPERVAERVKHLTLDGLGCGLVGSNLPWSKTAVEAVMKLEGEGTIAIWGWGRGASPVNAALLNGTFVQGFELDDYHEFGPLHAASIMLPTAFSTAQHVGGVSGQQLLVAIAAGLEMGPRIGMTMDGHHLIAHGFHCGVVYGAVAAAITASKVRGLDATLTEDAIGIAATQACGLMSAQYEAMVKRMNHAFAGRAGVLAAALAEGGFTGAKDAIERDYGGLAPTFMYRSSEELDYSYTTDDLGTHWELENIIVKPYSSGGTTHPAVDAMFKARDELGIKAEEVEAINIRLPIHSAKHYGWQITRPTTTIGAQMNLGYVSAVALVDGLVSIGQFTDARIDADEVWEVVNRITCVYDPEMDRIAQETKTPRATGFTITLKDGTVHEFLQLAATGKGDLILTNAQIDAKFDELMSHVMDESRAKEIKDRVLSLDTLDDVGDLVELISSPVRAPL